MTDIEKAIMSLEGHTLALCRGNTVLTSDKRGVSPMLDFIERGYDLAGFSAADVVVGKAAAMLFTKVGIKEVYAKTISKSGLEYLTLRGIPAAYETLTDRIINREGTGICPMEEATSATDDHELGFELIKKKRDELAAKAHK